jgi:hypothetical protein
LAGFSTADFLVTEAGFALTYALGLGAIAARLVPMTAPRLKVAKVCFVCASLIIAGLAIYWGMVSEMAFVPRALVIGIICAAAGIAAMETSRFLAANTEKPEAPKVDTAAPANKMGDVSNNSGIITQGQSGDNRQ